MADIITTTRSLSLTAKYTDTNTRTITINDPQETVTSELIKAFETAAKKVLVYDSQYNAALASIDKAAIIRRTVRTYDLS